MRLTFGISSGTTTAALVKDLLLLLDTHLANDLPTMGRRRQILGDLDIRHQLFLHPLFDDHSDVFLSHRPDLAHGASRHLDFRADRGILPYQHHLLVTIKPHRQKTPGLIESNRAIRCPHDHGDHPQSIPLRCSRDIETCLGMETGLEPIDAGKLIDEFVGIRQNEFAFPEAISPSLHSRSRRSGYLDKFAGQNRHIVCTGQVTWIPIGWRQAMNRLEVCIIHVQRLGPLIHQLQEAFDCCPRCARR